MLRATGRLARRILITTAGIVVLGIGVVLLVAPGPGFLVIALGFLILGLEYEWARKRFEQVRDKALDLSDKAASNKLSTAGSILFGLGMIAFGVALIVFDNIPGSGWISGISVIVAALAVLATVFYSLNRLRHLPVDAVPTEGQPVS